MAYFHQKRINVIEKSKFILDILDGVRGLLLIQTFLRYGLSKSSVLPNSVLFGGTVPPNSVLSGGTVPPNSVLFGVTVPPNSFPQKVWQPKKLW